jgi:hypothetical protein
LTEKKKIEIIFNFKYCNNIIMFKINFCLYRLCIICCLSILEGILVTSQHFPNFNERLNNLSYNIYMNDMGKVGEAFVCLDPNAGIYGGWVNLVLPCFRVSIMNTSTWIYTHIYRHVYIYIYMPQVLAT